MPATMGERQQWVRKKTLGSGSFGEVILYQHGVNSSCIAVKKCKLQLQHENMQRWRDEVAFMARLEHDHIVKGLPLPAELDALPGELPCLGMEFCSRGDLRKKLSEPAHVCGIREAETLLLARHISSAMEYLHQQKIIHRDIKPENIMIQDQGGKNVYKLTDLGFAKDSKNQPAVSFVGTREYMAPELYSQRSYSETVDYWSFGTVISELITGNRPFMVSGMPLVTWLDDVIKRKTSTDIGYYEDSQGNMAYSKILPLPSQLCRPMKESMENWLGLMLKTEPGSRGGDIRNNRRTCYIWLDMILSCKIVHVRCMMDGKVRSYPMKPTDRVADLHKTLNRETFLPADKHILVLRDGTRLREPFACLNDYFRNQNEKSIVYMLQREMPPKTDNLFEPPLSDLVMALMQNNHTAVSENGFKLMWKQALYYCHHLMHDGEERVAAFQAFLNYNLLLNKEAKAMQGELRDSMQSLRAKNEFFNESVSTDVKMFAHQIRNGITSEKFQPFCTESKAIVEGLMEEPEQKSAELEQRTTALALKVVEMQRRVAGLKSVDPLVATITKSDAIFLKFKEENKVKRREAMDCTPIQDQVRLAQRQFSELNRAIFTNLRDVQQSCQSIEDLIAEIKACVDKVRTAEEKISAFQKQRQQGVWEIISATVQKTQEMEVKLQKQASRMQSQISRAQSLVSPSTPPNGSDIQPFLPVFPTPTADGDSNLTPASLMVLNESSQLKSQFDTCFEDLRDNNLQSLQQIQSLDWGHLSDTP